MVEYEGTEREVWVLTAEGREIASHGSHEAKVFSLVPPGEEGIPVSEIQVCWVFGGLQALGLADTI